MGIGKINRVKVSLESYPPYIFIAPRKFGKTTWWSKLVPYVWGDATKGLLIAFEEGYHSLDGVNVESVRDWNSEYDEETDRRGFVQIVDDIVENNDEYGLKAVCIDTIDAMVEAATKEVLKQHKKEKKTVVKTLNEAFSGYGRGKKRLLDICNEQIQRLRDAGVAVFILGHIKLKEKTDTRSGEKYEQITNNLTDDIFTNFGDDAQMVMVGAFDREIVNGKILSEERYIYLRNSAAVDAGGRFTAVPEKITLDVADFMEAFENAVKAEMKDGKDKDIKKIKAEEEKEIKRLASVAKKREIEAKETGIDLERNEELKSEIQSKVIAMKDEKSKTAFKKLMEENGIESFADVSEIPTKILEEILKNIA